MSKHHKSEDLPYRPGVGLVLFNAEGFVFAARRIDTEQEAWQFPQGGIDNDETPEEAARRELEEETGVSKAEIIAESHEWLTYDLPADLIGKVWKGRYRGQTQKWYALRFTGTDADINIHSENAEFSDWRWMKLADLVDKIVPFKRDLYARIVAEFQHLAAK